MALANRALFGSRFEENNRPGIEMNVDGSMEVVLPDGSRNPLTGGPGGGAVEVLGPFEVTYQAANLIDPADNGYEIAGLTITAGSLARVFAIQTDAWDGAAGGDELYLYAATAVDAALSQLAVYDLAGVSPGLAEGMAVEFNIIAASVAGARQYLAPTVDAKVFAAVYLSGGGPITAGAMDVYALVYTP